MFGLFKVRDKGNSPNELVDYCEKNNLPALSVLTIIAHTSAEIGRESSTNFDGYHRNFSLTFSYLVAYASWIGAKRGKFQEPLQCAWGNGAATHLPTDAGLATKNGPSAAIVRLLMLYYSDPANLKVAEKFYGGYSTDADLGAFSKRLKDFLILTFLWSNLGWSDEAYNAALGTINAEWLAPSTFYREENSEMRRFWNIAFLAEWIVDVMGDLNGAAKGMQMFILISGATAEISNLINTIEFPWGFDR